MTLLKALYDGLISKAHNQERPPAINQGAGNFTSGGLGGGNLSHMATYSTISWVFAAVSKIAEAVASSEWHLYQGPGTAKEIFTHPALTLWESANAFDTRQDFLEMSQQHFELTGEMWWVLVRNARGIPVEMWAVRPDRMAPIKDHDEYIKGYIYTLGSEKIFFDLEDVIFIRHPNPLDPYRGMGPIQSLILDLGSEVEAANFNRSFFRNDATPGGIIETDRAMSNTDFNKLVERWKTMHQGTANAGRMGFLERAKFVERKYTQRDMQFVQLRQQTRDLVLAAYGVPLPMLGVMEAPSRSNAQAAEFIFARWTIKPRLERIRLSLNTKLLKLYPERGLHFEFVDPTPNNRELDLEEATKGYEAGLMLLNEGRAILGLGEIEGGDKVKPTGGSPFTLGVKDFGYIERRDHGKALADQLGIFDGIPPDKGGAPQLKAPTPLDIAERVMQLAWTRRLKAEAEGLVAFLEEQFAKFAGTLNLKDPIVDERLTALIDYRWLDQITKIEVGDVAAYDWDWWTKYKTEVIEELAAAFKAAMVNIFPMEPLLADDLATQYAETRGARLLRVDGDLNIVNATRSRVNSLVAQTIERGDSLQTLQRALRDDLAFSPQRATTVARTETATAQGQGALGAAVAQDFNEKRWITQGDDVVDATGGGTPCLDAEAQGWIKMGDPFISGFDTIPAHPNCRCNVRYRRAPVVELAADHSITRCPFCGGSLVLNNQGPGMYCRKCKAVISTERAHGGQWQEKVL